MVLITNVYGPNLVLRLENSKKHPIYLFGDWHMSLNSQRECPVTQDSIRVDHLFRKLFKANKNKIGLYVEITRDMITHYADDKNHYVQPYIHLMRTLLSNNVKFHPKTKTIHTSEEFPNVMFHYTDLRSESVFGTFVNTSFDQRAVLDAVQQIHNLKSMAAFAMNDLNKNKDFVKVLNQKYNDSSIQDAITGFYQRLIKACNKYLDKDYEKGIKQVQKYIDFYHKHKTELDEVRTDELVNKISNVFYNLRADGTTYCVLLNDLYTLRRLLDKRYKTSVDYIYCGGMHALNMALFLIKYTDYKLTHSTGNHASLIKNVKNYSPDWFTKNSLQIVSSVLGYNYYVEPVTQCVDLSAFPKQLI